MLQIWKHKRNGMFMRDTVGKFLSQDGDGELVLTMIEKEEGFYLQGK